jgi:hypothetical protein
MKYLQLFLKDILKRPSLYFFVFVIIFSIDRHHRYESSIDDENGPFYSDVFEYYSFLPEYFLDFKQVPEQNFKTTKRTVGMAVMYAPAFFVGHWIAQYTGDVDDGYSPPYHWSIRWGSIIYCLLGLMFCRKNLLLFFKDPIVVIALACIFFGTNLFYYTYGSGEFPHSYLFFLNSAFIYFTLRWIREERSFFLLLLCLAGGMITLIRPTGIMVFLFPLLFNVTSTKAFKERIRFIFKKWLITFLAALLFLMPLLFQALIWKKYQGHYIYYSYRDEHFFFNDPQVVNFLFSIRKGWLIYTPIMIFSLAGIILSKNRLKEFFLFLLIYFILNVYVLSSWWEWSYGGSFGCRVLVESYAFLIFPFAVFVSWFWQFKKENKFRRNMIRVPLIFMFYLLIELNLFQTWQFKYGRIHWSGMNWETYKFVFLREITTEEANYLDTRFTPPDTERMKRGDRDQ